MAWKVYGFLNASDGRKTFYGPHPRKRWIAIPGEKRPRAKKLAMRSTRGFYDKNDQVRDGIEYARWLAARDGKALPYDARAAAIWDTVTLPTGKLQSRVRAVSFAGQPAGFIIDIPNWAWIPAEPVLEINSDYFRDLLAIPAESLEIAA